MWWNKPKTCEKCQELESRVKAQRIDFEELQDKVYHWMKRTAARVARGQGAGQGDSVEGSGPGATAEDGDPGRVSATDGAPPVRPENRARVAALLARRMH